MQSIIMKWCYLIVFLLLLPSRLFAISIDVAETIYDTTHVTSAEYSDRGLESLFRVYNVIDPEETNLVYVYIHVLKAKPSKIGVSLQIGEKKENAKLFAYLRVYDSCATHFSIASNLWKEAKVILTLHKSCLPYKSEKNSKFIINISSFQPISWEKYRNKELKLYDKSHRSKHLFTVLILVIVIASSIFLILSKRKLHNQ